MHGLRRSAVRRLIRRGVAEKVAMQISGHKTRHVFGHYSFTNERDLEQAAKLLEPGQAPISEAENASENPHEPVTSGFAHS
jgi:hypothetical protein